MLRNEGFLVIRKRNGSNVNCLKTPCTFRYRANVLQSLKENYLADEEIGGVLWAEPVMAGEEVVYHITAVRFIRNACEDNPRDDGRTKRNTYRPDNKALMAARKDCLAQGCLPIFFHTHPTNKGDIFMELVRHDHYTETSVQDRVVSEKPRWVGDELLLLPDCLVVGNSTPGGDTFVGLYNGGISPATFATAKKQLAAANIKQKIDSIPSTKLTKRQGWMVIAAVVLALAIIMHYRKHMVPALLIALPMIFALISRTGRESAPYCNYASTGDVSIGIPDWEEGEL